MPFIFYIVNSNEEEMKVENNATENTKAQSEKCQVTAEIT